MRSRCMARSRVDAHTDAVFVLCARMGNPCLDCECQKSCPDNAYMRDGAIALNRADARPDARPNL